MQFFYSYALELLHTNNPNIMELHDPWKIVQTLCFETYEEELH